MKMVSMVFCKLFYLVLIHNSTHFFLLHSILSYNMLYAIFYYMNEYMFSIPLLVGI